MTDLPPKKKFWWAFEGRGEHGETIFPLSPVKVHSRPPFPCMAVGDEDGGKIIPCPGEFGFTLHSPNAEAFKFLFGYYEDIHNLLSRVTWGRLRLILRDVVFEEWLFYEAVLRITQIDSEEVVADFRIKYQSPQYICHKDVLT